MMAAATCNRVPKNSWMEERLDVEGKDNHTKPYRKKSTSTVPRSTRGTRKYFNINNLFLIIIVIFNLITVTIANVNLTETNLNIKNLFNSVSLSDNKSQSSSNVLILINLKGDATAQLDSGLLEKDATTTSDETAVKDFHLLEKRENDAISKDYGRKEEFRNQTMLSTFQKRRRRRKKRYVRFPPGEGGGRLANKFHSRPFYSGPQISGGGYSSGFFPWNPVVRPNSFYTHIPTMRPRSPRLVFRDPVEPGTLSAPSGFFGSGLQDIGYDDDRGCGVSIGKLGAQRRIVGGDEAGFGSFPWQAYIRIGSSRCGGSLVNRFHVVTAGHCVARASARQVQVTLGDYVINSAVEPLPAYTFGVREIRVHPYFKFTPQADRFDVAVLRLDRPVQYMPHIAPICLPEKNEDFLGQYGWAAGWGALQAGSRLRPKTLQAVDVPVIDNRQCERWHKSNGINVVIYDEMMCAGYRNGGKDSCQGDSGGPLMMEKANRWYLIGIVSAGYSCAQRGQPGIYHRVAHTVDWISYIINS